MNMHIFMNMHISLFAYLDNTKTEIEFNFIRCHFHKPKLSQSRNMSGLQIALSNSKIVIGCHGNRMVLYLHIVISLF